MVHWFWIGEYVPDYHDWVKKCVEKTQTDELCIWTKSDLNHIDIDWDDDPRHISNVVRYFLLHKYGGLWLDCDVIPLTDLCSQTSFVAGLGGKPEGACMRFHKPGSLFMEECFNESLRNTTSERSPLRSGSRMLHRIIKRHSDVNIRNDLFSHDRNGSLVNKFPKCVHLWATSSGR